MANQPESNDLPTSDEREDSGLQDILAVAAKIKEAPEDELADGDTSEREDSGVILFKAGDLGGEDAAAGDEDEGLFGSFAGGLGAGFETSVDPASSPDIVPLGGEGGVSETSPAEVRPKPTEEPKRNPLTVLAVVLGLGLVAAGAVYLTNDDKQPAAQQAQAEMSANPEGDAAVGKAEPTPEEQASGGASGGAAVEPAPEPEPAPEAEAVGETEGAVLEGEDADGLLAAAEGDAEDPMARKAGLLEGGSNPVAKTGKWDQGHSKKAAADPVEPEPEPEPVAAPDPEPEPLPVETKPAGGGKEDDVKCLLEPDLPECNKAGAPKPKEEVVLAPKLPEKLDKNALRSGFNKVKSKAKACGTKHGAEPGTVVKIHASIQGATGKVTSVSATGQHAGTELGKCVEGAVEKASFEQFKHASQGVDYSMIM